MTTIRELPSFTGLRIGIPAIGSTGWLGGVSYIELLIRALRSLPEGLQPSIDLILSDPHTIEPHLHLFPLCNHLRFIGPSVAHLKSSLSHPAYYHESLTELAPLIDGYFPANTTAVNELPAASWIPDFQHKVLTHLFDATEIKKRDDGIERILRDAPLLVLSSASGESDFRRFYPHASIPTSRLSFYSLPDEKWYLGSPNEIALRYGICNPYLICCNQFWAHKNHLVLFEAIGLLKSKGVQVRVVCTGSTGDYRDPEHFPRLKARIADLGISDHVSILGVVPRADQIQLIRGSLALVQPSLFEGWSTVIEDGRALGKTMLMSDIDVHIEQSPAHGQYFKRNSPEDLARLIEQTLPSLTPGPVRAREEEARVRMNELVVGYLEQFHSIMRTLIRSTKKTADAFISQAAPETIIATSVGPKRLDEQLHALQSWRSLGESIVSVNHIDDQVYLDQVRSFCAVHETRASAKEIVGRPLIYIDEILKFFVKSGAKRLLITNSDITLTQPHELKRIIESTPAHLIFGHRLDIDSEGKSPPQLYPWGFDYFILDRALAQSIPESKFAIGAPWWDYWLPLISILLGAKVVRVLDPVVSHVTHPLNWSTESHAWYAKHIAEFLAAFMGTLKAGQPISKEHTAVIQEVLVSYLLDRRERTDALAREKDAAAPRSEIDWDLNCAFSNAIRGFIETHAATYENSRGVPMNYGS